MNKPVKYLLIFIVLVFSSLIQAQQYYDLVPLDQRGDEDYVRQGTHDANRIRTLYYNYGMVGDYQTNPDYTIFHSMEWPKGSLENYSDGVTPFVLAKLQQFINGQYQDFYIMETGYRERQETNPNTGRVQRYNPRPGFLQLDPTINK